MKLILNKRTKVKDLKKQFMAFFPYLKIEFFQHEHQKGESSLLEHMLNDGDIISQVTPSFREGEFVFLPNIAVANFEQRLQNEHGLPVQVFRRSGHTWLETVQTDNLTLARQDQMAKEASRLISFNINTLFL